MKRSTFLALLVCVAVFSTANQAMAVSMPMAESRAYSSTGNEVSVIEFLRDVVNARIQNDLAKVNSLLTVENIRNLIEHDKVGINLYYNPAGITLLLVALDLNDNPEIIRMLLNAGAEVNVRRGDGATPLLIAAENSKPEVIRG